MSNNETDEYPEIYIDDLGVHALICTPKEGDPTSPFWRRSVLSVHWKDWCWSWNSNTLATWCEELTHLKNPWFWERLRAGGEGDNRGWDGWMASLTQWRWVWVNSKSWWWTGRPGMLRSMGSQRTGHDWATELNWTELKSKITNSQSWTASLYTDVAQMAWVWLTWSRISVDYLSKGKRLKWKCMLLFLPQGSCL